MRMSIGVSQQWSHVHAGDKPVVIQNWRAILRRGVITRAPVSQAIMSFLSVRTQEGFSQHTISAYRLQHQLLVRDIGDLDIKDVTLQVLRDHLNHHGHLKPASLGHKIRSIKSLFNWLVEEELLLRNPTLKLNEPKRGKRVPKALTIEELELLRDSCTSALEHALIEFFFASGCRVAEIQRLNRSEIDLQRAQ